MARKKRIPSASKPTGIIQNKKTDKHKVIGLMLGGWEFIDDIDRCDGDNELNRKGDDREIFRYVICPCALESFAINDTTRRKEEKREPYVGYLRDTEDAAHNERNRGNEKS